MKWMGVAAAGALLALLAGCAGVVSEAIRSESVPVAGLGEIREAPETFRDKTVILGGEVIEVRNRTGGSELLILEKPLDKAEQPVRRDVTGGRFLVRTSEFLDPVLFAAGRRITVAGTVTGVETENVGEAPYPYVVLRGKEIHLWRESAYAPQPPWYPYDPWYPWWYDPRWGQRPWWW